MIENLPTGDEFEPKIIYRIQLFLQVEPVGDPELTVGGVYISASSGTPRGVPAGARSCCWGELVSEVPRNAFVFMCLLCSFHWGFSLYVLKVQFALSHNSGVLIFFPR